MALPSALRLATVRREEVTAVPVAAQCGGRLELGGQVQSHGWDWQ